MGIHHESVGSSTVSLPDRELHDAQTVAIYNILNHNLLPIVGVPIVD